ncbi:MAG TPA: hypothetical protein VHM31_25245 [Polyangia bacterium]|nr:hypothetical protein [Polyangia bacterium]
MTAAGAARRVFVVCEDGSEYIDRFRRFLGQSFDFVPAADFASARDRLAGTDGLLLDLDFRRTPPERLIDEQGRSAAVVDAGTRARLAETQGILILRRLRAEGVVTPAVLFADLDDAAQAEFLRRTLAPLTLAPSRLGLRELAALLRGY